MLKNKKGKKMETADKMATLYDENEYTLPLLRVDGYIIGPEINTVIDLDTEDALLAVEYAAKTSHLLCFVNGFDPKSDPQNTALKKIGCIADMRDIVKISHNSVRISVKGINRGIIWEYRESESFYMTKVSPFTYDMTKVSEEEKILMQLLVDKYIGYLNLIGRFDDFYEKQLEEQHPDKVIDFITSNLPLSSDEYYSLMEHANTDARLKATIEILVRLTNIAEMELELEKELVLTLSNDQKARYLREKKQLINKELNEDDEDETIDEYRSKLEALPLQDEYKKRLLKEMDRFEMTPMGSQEASVIQSYLDYVLDLPWEKADQDDFDIKQASEILDNEHYGLEKVKERILEYLSVIKLTHSLKSPILCLVGPPGVGKTSIAKSIANAIGRKFVRISLGGMHDEAEIRGHRKTYVGAMPGRIIAGLRQVQSKNPVFLLDEIDKLTKDIKGDPASALLEALDPEQNVSFTDTYIEIPFDLSDVMFITTANMLSTIPAPLLDRMEVIELPGYMPSEKLEIAKRHLIEKQMKLNGITQDNLVLDDEILYEIIYNYTRESGVRQLERSISALCRKAAKNLIVDGNEKLTLTKDTLSEYLGKKVHTYDIAKDESVIGVVNGLAWTSVGGDMLQIEVAIAEGSGKLELTGQLGDVMKESAKTAIGHIRANADKYDAQEIHWDKIDIHVHVPEGAVPKDGPSAGITMTTALISALTKKAVAQKTAMTGEITLVGKVLPIGGLREKLLAANRSQITRVIIPTENKEDLKEIPEMILNQLEICYAETMHDVYHYIFEENAQ